MNIDKKFIEDRLLTKSGNLNPRALEQYSISKDAVYQIYNGLSAAPSCKECGNATTFISFNKGYTMFCSSSCVSKHKDIKDQKQQTLTSNFGILGFKSEKIQNKKKETCIERYGVDNRRKNPEYINTLKQKFLIKYGISNPANTSSANAKRKATNIIRYGYENPCSNPIVIDKIKSTNIEKYGVSTALLLPDNRASALATRKDETVYEKLDNPIWLAEHKHFPSTLMSEQLGVAFSTILCYYKKHNIIRPTSIVSKYELQLASFLEANHIQYECNNRTILDGKEIDIFLPEFNIGIEIDGLYWHSDQFKTDKFYHIKKNELATSKNIQLIHITDSELNNKLEIVHNRILAKIGKSQKYYARKCSIVELDSNTYTNFMIMHHMQGSAVASVRIGLQYDNQVIAIMSFSKARYNKNYKWELIRYASVGTVVGGASRLFKYFLKKYTPESIISYADLRWNTGSVYEKIGMTYDHTSLPNYWYIVNGQLVHRSSYQKHKLNSKLLLFDNTLSERDNMKNNGYLRYWDCGNKVFTWMQ